MPLKSGFRNIQAQIEEIKLKISLLEDDKKAYHENTEQMIKENRENILTLRRENKIKRKEIAKNSVKNIITLISADGDMIGKSLQRLPTDMKFLTKHSATVAIETLDEKTCDLIKSLNILRYERKNKESELQNLQKQNDVLTDSNSSSELITSNLPDLISDSNMVVNNGTNFINPKHLELENQLDKTRMKCREAEQIQHTYHLIRSNLEDEQQALPSILDEVEADIKRLQGQLKQLKTLEKDAKATLEAAKNEYEKKEKIFLSAKKSRDSELARVKRDIDENKMHGQAVQQRIKNRGTSSSVKSPNSNQATMAEVEENNEKIKSYEEAFSIIKKATGISDTKELVRRFKTQQYRSEQLNELKEKNDAILEMLTNEKLKKQQEFQQLEYKKTISSLREDDENNDEKVDKRSALKNENFLAPNNDANLSDKNDEDDEAKKREILMKLERSSNLLTQLKTGVEHLHDKLKTFQIEDLVSNNDEEDGDVMTRNDMKKLAQQIIENKTKRRQVKRKKNIAK
ncbi:hypothetical protein HELRODRAFT_180495 [Helobdella robusta]|uniref:Uncharacterized protein n=1 Tax=Helobdella robusta TaxID=6412 RepID=T1FFZ5_HELRO|nr:hypothetical protein HELRODRAFT_180495 [Helobdella robusta]ESN93844.1 hypothetical protein HELRODRAFT_180495 [Helobdella robusta]